MALFVLVLVMWFAPKIATVIDVLTAAGAAPRVRRHRAVPRQLRHRDGVLRSCCRPIMWFGHTMFLAGLLFGRAIGWIGQTRDDHAVPLALALQQSLAAHAARAAPRSACSP